MDIAFRAMSESALNGVWEGVTPTGFFENDELVECTFRPHQREVFNKYGQSQYVSIVHPCGSGKSTLIKFCHGHDIMHNPGRKVIIAVPLEGIAKTFRTVLLDFDDGERLMWSVGIDLCKPQNGTGKIESVVGFLEHRDFTDNHRERVLLCTHSALAAANREIAQRGDRDALFHNTTIVIDEAHHILDTKDQNGEDMNNQIGDLINRVVSNRKTITDSKVWLVTATYVRGDCLSILSPANASVFDRHYLPLDKHWRENFRYIKSYEYSFVNYNGGLFQDITKILKQRPLKTIIYCPPSNHWLAKRKANGCKIVFRDKVVKAVREVWPDANILDLIDEDGREDRKNDILMSPKEMAKQDIVLTIGMMDEGVDWPDCAQVLDLAPSESLRIAIQRFGRPMRDVPGKENIYYVSFLPMCLAEITDREAYQLHLNACHARLNSSLLLEDMLVPVAAKTPESDADESISDGAPNWFLYEVPDMNDRNKILSDIEKELLIQRGAADEKDGPFTAHDAHDAITGILKAKGVKRVKQVASQIVTMFRRRLLRYGEGMEWAVDAGFEHLWHDKILDDLLGFVAKGCGITTFEHYRKISASKREAEWEAEWAYYTGYCQKFFKEHGRVPAADSDDEKEADAGAWVVKKQQETELRRAAEAKGIAK